MKDKKLQRVKKMSFVCRTNSGVYLCEISHGKNGFWYVNTESGTLLSRKTDLFHLDGRQFDPRKYKKSRSNRKNITSVEKDILLAANALVYRMQERNWSN